MPKTIRTKPEARQHSDETPFQLSGSQSSAAKTVTRRSPRRRSVSTTRTHSRGFPPSALWDYAVAVYARPEAAGACLSLQARSGADVNLLLLACWLGATGRGVPGPAAWRDLAAQVAVWQEQVVRPLRAVRERLKLMTADASAPTQGLRRAVSACELDAEHIELLMLEQAVQFYPVGRDPDPAQGARDAACNLRDYLGGFATPTSHHAARALLVVAFPDLQQAEPAWWRETFPDGVF